MNEAVEEWPGSRPRHWNTSRRIIAPPTGKRERKHFNLKKSAELVFKPLINPIIPKIEEKIKRGKKYIEPNYSDPPIYTKKLLHRNVNIKIEEYKPLTKKLSEKEKVEYHIETELGSKIRPDILISTGSKTYKNVDYSSNFFKEGGLAFSYDFGKIKTKNAGKRGDNFYEYLDLSIPTLDKNKLWGCKLEKENMSKDKNYVLNLSNWEEILAVQKENLIVKKK